MPGAGGGAEAPQDFAPVGNSPAWGSAQKTRLLLHVTSPPAALSVLSETRPSAVLRQQHGSPSPFPGAL